MKKTKRLSILAALITTSSALAHTVVYPHAHPHEESSVLMDIAIALGIFGLAGLVIWLAVRRVVARRARKDS